MFEFILGVATGVQLVVLGMIAADLLVDDDVFDDYLDRER